MQALINYLNHLKSARRIALIVENSDFKGLASAFPIHEEMSCVHIYSSERMLRLSYKQTILNEYKKQGFPAPSIRLFQYCLMNGIEYTGQEYDLVLFDTNVNYKTVKSLVMFKPEAICGRIWTDMVPYFDVWESFKTISSNIFLQVIDASGKIETLEWKKDTISDIEVSVVFPVYNVAKYLPKCIETVTAWQAPYIEFLFVNDGSPDNSRDIILEYQKRDSRIKLIDKINGGCASARKKGMECASGKYIGFFDPDDFIHPDMYHKLLRRALLGNYDVCYCGYKEYYESTGLDKDVQDAILEPYIHGITQQEDIQKLIMYARVAIWRGIYKRSFLVENNINFYEDLKRFDDLPFKVETFASANSVVTLPEYLYYYRLQRPGQDVSCADERLYVHFDIFDHLDQSIGAYRNQHLLDYLQIVKFQTHQYAYDKIDRKYARVYYKKMMRDMKKNMGLIRTASLIGHYLGKSKKREFLFLAYHFPMLYKLNRNLISNKEEKELVRLNKHKELIDKLM